MVDTIPQIEAEMQRLDRDYEVNRRQYELLAPRDRADFPGCRRSGENVQFRIIDPARLPREADGPNRPLISPPYGARPRHRYRIGLPDLAVAPGGQSAQPVRSHRLPGVARFPDVVTCPAARSRIELAGFTAAGVVLLIVWTGIVMLAPAAHSLVSRFI